MPNFVEPFFGSGAVLLGRPHPARLETINDMDGYVCLVPETKVLLSDLRWVPIGELQEGQQLLAFDEENSNKRIGFVAPGRYRHWKHSTVLSVQRLSLPCYRLTFDDGTVVTASEDHCWLAGSHTTGGNGRGGRAWRWVRTKNMICNRKNQRTWVLKLIPVVKLEETWESGWMAGFLDGEGSLISRPGLKVSLAQNPGLSLDFAEQWLNNHGFQTFREQRKKCTHLAVNGGMTESLRLLMLTRPHRLMKRLVEVIESASVYGRKHQAVGLVSKEFIKIHEVVAISTTSKTFIAEGLASHNCNFWRAVKAAPEAVAEHADNPVNENDLHARHSWLVARKQGFSAQLDGDPEFFDAKVAGWWCWGLCCWIGSGWCSGNGPWQSVEMPDGTRQLVHLGDAGRGVNRKRVHLGDAGMGDGSEGILEWMLALAERLKRVRVCCGDWSRVCGPTPTVRQGLTGVFLDPPYPESADRDGDLYTEDDLDVAHDVAAWAIANGDDRRLRVAFCGYEGSHDFPENWRCVAWKARGGYGSQSNAARERIWFSPHCLKQDGPEQGVLDF